MMHLHVSKGVDWCAELMGANTQVCSMEQATSTDPSQYKMRSPTTIRPTYSTRIHVATNVNNSMIIPCVHAGLSPSPAPFRRRRSEVRQVAHGMHVWACGMCVGKARAYERLSLLRHHGL